MQIPITIKIKDKDKLVTNLFDGKMHKTIVLDRAKLQFRDSHLELEGFGHTIHAEISMLTGWGGIAVAKYLVKNLGDDPVARVKIGNSWYRLFKDELREAIEKEYLKLKN